MKRIACSLRALNRVRSRLALLALIAAALAAVAASASTRPRNGGTLRVQLHERVVSLDPRQWPADSVQAAAAERLTALVFDRLARLDNQGAAQPALAISWEHDAEWKRWQFRLRPGVKFSDGAALTPEIAALALQQLLGNTADVSATSDSIVIRMGRAAPDLPAQLAAGPYFIFHAAEDGSLSGTGAFRAADWPAAGAAAKVVLAQSESCWAGRPFVDRIELLMGVNPEDQANAVAFGQADVVELNAAQVRIAAQRGVHTASSEPVDLFALSFDLSRPSVQDARLREAIALAIDRAALANVVLQHQGVPAGGLLPNWISGYAHLFPSAPNAARAKELLASTGGASLRAAPLRLSYDSGDMEARSVAERVAVNLGDVGITVQAIGQNAGVTTKAQAPDMRLVRRHITSPDRASALRALLESLGEPAAATSTIEEAFAAEIAPIHSFRLIPLTLVSESYGLGSAVRDWMAPRWGGWRLEDVWLDAPAAGGGTPP